MSSLLMDQFTKALVHVFEVAIRYNLQLTPESVQYKKSTVGPDGCHGAIDDWVPFGLTHLPKWDPSGRPTWVLPGINLGLSTWIPYILEADIG